MDKFSSRLDQYDTPFKINTSKSIHNEYSTELRKSKRLYSNLKNRKIALSNNWIDLDQHYNEQYSIEEIQDLIPTIHTQETSEQLFIAQAIRKLLSRTDQKHIQDIIDTGILPILSEWLRFERYPQLQYETCWIIVNISSGTENQTKKIIQQGVIPSLISLISSPIEEVAELALWALGNIGSDSSSSRDLILQEEGLRPLINFALSNKTRKTLKRAITTISILCRGKPTPNYQYIQEALPSLIRGVTLNEENLTWEIYWSFYFITQYNRNSIQDLVELGAVSLIIDSCSAPIFKIILPAHKVLGNLITASDKFAQIVIENGGLNIILRDIENDAESVRKEVFHSICNLCAGTKDQIEELITIGIIERTIQKVIWEEGGAQREAAWAIAYALVNGSWNELEYIVNRNVFGVLHILLGSTDDNLVLITLIGVLKLVEKAEKESIDYWNDLEDIGAIAFLEKLQYHPNTKIYEKVSEILEKGKRVLNAEEENSVIALVESCFDIWEIRLEMEKIFDPISVKIAGIGATFISSKKHFEWVFSVDGEKHTVELECSFLTNKRRVLVDNQLKYNGIKVIGMTFSKDFIVGNRKVCVKNEGNDADLLVEELSFNAIYSEKLWNRKHERRPGGRMIRGTEMNENFEIDLFKGNEDTVDSIPNEFEDGVSGIEFNLRGRLDEEKEFEEEGERRERGAFEEEFNEYFLEGNLGGRLSSESDSVFSSTDDLFRNTAEIKEKKSKFGFLFND